LASSIISSELSAPTIANLVCLCSFRLLRHHHPLCACDTTPIQPSSLCFRTNIFRKSMASLCCEGRCASRSSTKGLVHFESSMCFHSAYHVKPLYISLRISESRPATTPQANRAPRPPSCLPNCDSWTTRRIPIIGRHTQIHRPNLTFGWPRLKQHSFNG